MQNIFVTGCAGFIGSSFVDALLSQNFNVVGYDNLSTGQLRFLDSSINHPSFRFIEGDLLDKEKLQESMLSSDIVFHFAANADVRHGPDHPGKDLEQNTICTFNVLESMRANQINKIVFSSTGSVYGEAAIFPTPEDAPFPVQTSLYGASKLAGESLISSYCHAFGFQSWIFRFVSILGERYTHGHVVDFCRQLLLDPSHLRILGDGTQRKSYLYIGDCIHAVLSAIKLSTDPINIFNLGTPEYCTVNDSVGWICSELGVNPKLIYSGGDRGWIGDNPFIFLDTTRISGLGWKPHLTIQESVINTVQYIKANPWVLGV